MNRELDIAKKVLSVVKELVGCQSVTLFTALNLDLGARDSDLDLLLSEIGEVLEVDWQAMDARGLKLCRYVGGDDEFTSIIGTFFTNTAIFFRRVLGRTKNAEYYPYLNRNREPFYVGDIVLTIIRKEWTLMMATTEDEIFMKGLQERLHINPCS